MKSDGIYGIYLPLMSKDKQMCWLVTILIIAQSYITVSRYTLQCILAFLWRYFLYNNQKEIQHPYVLCIHF